MLTVNNPKNFDWSSMSLHDCAKGNALDAYFTLKLFHICEEKLQEYGMLGLYENLMAPATKIFKDMEYKGLDVSQSKLKEVGEELSEKNEDHAECLYIFKQVNNDDNLSSNNDLIEILYTRDEGFNLYPPDKTAKGSPSVSAPTMKLLLEYIENELRTRE